MIRIVVKMKVPAEHAEAFQAMAKEMVEKSAAEEGNVSYTLNVSQTDPTCYSIIECWRDQAAIDAHNQTAHFRTIIPQLGRFCEGPSSADRYSEITF